MVFIVDDQAPKANILFVAAIAVVVNIVVDDAVVLSSLFYSICAQNVSDHCVCHCSQHSSLLIPMRFLSRDLSSIHILASFRLISHILHLVHLLVVLFFVVIIIVIVVIVVAVVVFLTRLV